MTLTDQITQQLDEIKEAGLYKSERTLSSPQSNHISVPDSGEVINLCANNYPVSYTHLTLPTKA